jgi:hypothetical protein
MHSWGSYFVHVPNYNISYELSYDFIVVVIGTPDLIRLCNRQFLQELWIHLMFSTPYVLCVACLYSVLEPLIQYPLNASVVEHVCGLQENPGPVVIYIVP